MSVDFYNALLSFNNVHINKANLFSSNYFDQIHYCQRETHRSSAYFYELVGVFSQVYIVSKKVTVSLGFFSDFF